MRQLENLTAYEVVEEKQLDEMNATGTVLRHKKSGARIFAVSCEDENKVFSIGFRTPPEAIISIPSTLRASTSERNADIPHPWRYEKS